MKNHKLSLYMLLLVLEPLILNAQTIEVSDSITTNTTWSADTVKVIDDVILAEDVVLSIDPGTYIEFQGHYQLKVSGIIQAVGTADEKIIFTIHDTTGFYDLDTTAGGWNGIRFNETPFSSIDTKFRHCIFEYGKATDGDEGTEVEEDYGGAIYIHDTYEEVTLDSCIIRYCKARWNGGAMYLGGAYNTLIQHCIIAYNSSYNGGAIYTTQTYDLKILNCYVFNNTAEYGGAFRLSTSDGLFVNNVVSNNESQYWGGALYALQGWNIRLFNNTVVNNKGRRGGGFYSFGNLYPHHLVNNIFWGNIAESDSQIYKDTQTIRIEYCNIEDESNGGNNINTNPLFISTTAGAGSDYDGSQANWSFKSLSPCINAGKPDFTLDSLGVSADITGNSRILNDTIDIGAHEVTPWYNMAIRFKKEGGIVQIPHSAELSPGQITVECWINKDSTLGYEYNLLDKRSSSSGYNLRLAGEQFPLSVHFILEGSGTDAAVSSSDLFDQGYWNHVAATYNGSLLSLYVNGQLVDTAEKILDISLSESPLSVGDFLGYPSSSLYFGGDMDELRIWNYARSGEQITDKMHDTLRGDEPGLVGYWPFDEIAGDTAFDRTGNGNDGVLGPEADFVPSTAPIGYIPPKPPVGLRVSGNDQSIDLTWRNEDEGVSRIEIYRGSTKDFELNASTLLATVSKPDSTYEDPDVTEGTWYYYRLIAVDIEQHQSTPSRMAVSRTVSTDAEFTTGVYYYPWYKDEPARWRDYIRNYTIPRQPPMLGHYDSEDFEVVQQHLDWMEIYGIDFLVSSWGGEEFMEDTVLKDYILPRITNSPLKFSVYYESAKLADENWNIIIDAEKEAELLDDITYLADTYFDHPNYLNVGNRPVLFIYLSGIYAGDYVDAFARIRSAMMAKGHDLFLVGDEGSWGEFSAEHAQFIDAISPYIVLPKRSHGDFANHGDFFADLTMLALQMEEITQSQGKFAIPNVNPGFNSNAIGKGMVFPRQIAPWAEITSFLESYIKVLRPFVDPQQRMIMITSWNEWYEDTQIEPTVITPPTSIDNSESGSYYTQGIIYEGYGYQYLEVVDELLSDGVSNVSNKNAGIDNSDKTFKLFPNPSKGYLNIYATANQTIASFEIYDVTGHLIMSRHVQKKQFTIQTMGLLPGIYFIKINTPDNYVIEKVIIE